MVLRSLASLLQSAPMNTQLDQTMEDASVALAKMDYLTCEDLCLAGLADARTRGDWAYYAAILLPLQEARRQRRMIAADVQISLNSPVELAGCVVLTPPSTVEDAKKLAASARRERRYVEVLFAEPTGGRSWLVRSYSHPAITCIVDAPKGALTADWFLDACEALGDSALAGIDLLVETPETIARLEGCLEVVTDHEALHQRLAALARRLARNAQ